MADQITSEARSRNMSAIRSKDTKPELYLRKLLFSKGFRYRKNDSRLPGKPDLYFPKYQAVIFVHGCFWHRHKGCKLAYTPKTRTEFWKKKFLNNQQRDETVKRLLEEKNLRILIVWECTIRSMKKSEAVEEEILNKIEDFLRSDCPYLEI